MPVTLDDFIAETLTGIVDGINKAKERLKADGRDDWVSPAIMVVGQGGEIHDSDVRVFRRGGYTSKANVVRFDVAVHAGETEEGGGHVGLKVASIVDVGGGKQTTSEDRRISRIQFEIPLVVAEPPEEEIAVRKAELQRLWALRQDNKKPTKRRKRVQARKASPAATR